MIIKAKFCLIETQTKFNNVINSYLPQKAVFRIKKSYESEENNTLTNDTSSTKSDKDTHSTSGLFSKFHKDLTSLGNMLKRRESVLCTKGNLMSRNRSSMSPLRNKGTKYSISGLERYYSKVQEKIKITLDSKDHRKSTCFSSCGVSSTKTTSSTQNLPRDKCPYDQRRYLKNIIRNQKEIQSKNNEQIKICRSKKTSTPVCQDEASRYRQKNFNYNFIKKNKLCQIGKVLVSRARSEEKSFEKKPPLPRKKISIKIDLSYMKIEDTPAPESEFRFPEIDNEHNSGDRDGRNSTFYLSNCNF